MRRGEVDLANDVLSTTTCFPLHHVSSLACILQLPFSSFSSHFINSVLVQGKPLPKFGEWDVNNPASAEGFTVIFSKASDEKKTKKASGSAGPSTLVSPQNTDQNNHQDSQNPKAKKKWLCF
ncbi:BnaA06g22650D [Brassica napus]|uniref:BnaA06g22650D protein n=1 Tax=Brassica napus TaxID=3708 RepID=A0A078HUM2_BRANA|nr:BnaA06g22650D [Brassica napus]